MNTGRIAVDGPRAKQPGTPPGLARDPAGDTTVESQGLGERDAVQTDRVDFVSPAITWPFFADLTLKVMYVGGDPARALLRNGPGGKPITYLWLLTLSSITMEASVRHKNSDFSFEQLYEFMRAVHHWVDGYQTPETYERARIAHHFVSDALSRLYGELWTLSKTQSANEARDRFIIEEYRKGTLLKKILEQVNATQGWSRLGSETAVLKALVRYCVRHGIDRPIRKQKRNKRG
jgi:hypothetical protein